MFIGYILVFFSYVTIGVMGYIGFVGTSFKSFFVNEEGTSSAGMISQNCLNMFDFKDVPAFVLRFAIFFLNFTTYPLLSFFINDLALKILFQSREAATRTNSIIVCTVILSVPLLCAIFYPNIGTILSYAGAISGFLIIYVFPIMVHLKSEHEKIKHPQMTNVTQLKEHDKTSKQEIVTEDATH